MVVHHRGEPVDHPRISQYIQFPPPSTLQTISATRVEIKINKEMLRLHPAEILLTQEMVVY
jgi:hypothetical protein